MGSNKLRALFIILSNFLMVYILTLSFSPSKALLILGCSVMVALIIERPLHNRLMDYHIRRLDLVLLRINALFVNEHDRQIINADRKIIIERYKCQKEDNMLVDYTRSLNDDGTKEVMIRSEIMGKKGKIAVEIFTVTCLSGFDERQNGFSFEIAYNSRSHTTEINKTLIKQPCSDIQSCPLTREPSLTRLHSTVTTHHQSDTAQDDTIKTERRLNIV